MYESRQGNIELKIVGYDEPNNGRELHIAELWINGKNCNDEYFKNNWNRLNFNLAEFQFESSDLKYIYIPAEGNSFVINTNTLEIISIPYKGVSTVCFKRNEFVNDKIIIYYTDETVEINLTNNKKMEDLKFSNEQIEEIANWTLSGLTMYYRDSQLSENEIQKYEVGQIFRSQTFVDVSNFAGKLTKNSRFIFATNKAAPLYQVNPDTEKWKLHTINSNSYFKVLDIYKKGEKTQFFLLHIPANGIDFFRNTVLRLGGNNLEEEIIEKSRISLDQKMEMTVIPELEEKEWVHRTSFPIGLDANGNFFTLQPTEEMMPQAIPLYNAIFKMTNDTQLNITEIVKQDKAEKKSGFWKKIFGKK